MIKLSRDFKIDLLWGLVGGIVTTVVCAMLLNCGPSADTLAAGGKFSVNLEECNRTSKTLCESIACENIFRAQAGRAPRAVPAHCKSTDAGDEK